MYAFFNKVEKCRGASLQNSDNLGFSLYQVGQDVVAASFFFSMAEPGHDPSDFVASFLASVAVGAVNQIKTTVSYTSVESLSVVDVVSLTGINYE